MGGVRAAVSAWLGRGRLGVVDAVENRLTTTMMATRRTKSLLSAGVRHGHRAGNSTREVAEDVLGAKGVAVEWDVESGIRLRTQRVLQKARAHAERSHRDT